MKTGNADDLLTSVNDQNKFIPLRAVSDGHLYLTKVRSLFYTGQNKQNHVHLSIIYYYNDVSHKWCLQV